MDALMLFASNPFEPPDPVRAGGNGLNSHFQDPCLAFQ